MTHDEKPKKKHHIPRWQFLLAWVGGQSSTFLVLLFLGFLVMTPLNLLGITLPPLLSYALIGIGFGGLTGWVQQWSIRRHFGHQVRGWGIVSALLTGLAMALALPFAIGLAFTQPALFEAFRIPLILGTSMTVFGASGLGQAILLRQHVKHSWLFFLSTLVGGIIYALPALNNTTASPFLQIAQFSVTAFTILWLFHMTGSSDALKSSSQADAIERLSQTASDPEAADSGYEDDDEQSQRGHRWLWLRRYIRQMAQRTYKFRGI